MTSKTVIDSNICLSTVKRYSVSTLPDAVSKSENIKTEINVNFSEWNIDKSRKKKYIYVMVGWKVGHVLFNCLLCFDCPLLFNSSVKIVINFGQNF